VEVRRQISRSSSSLPVTTQSNTNRTNIAKHGFSFEDAEHIFAGPSVSFEDDRFAYGEERLITLGLLAGLLVVIAHAPRG